jgi:hypothetical protein
LYILSDSKEKAEKCTEIQKIQGKSVQITSVDKKTVKTFSFDYVYDTASTQEVISFLFFSYNFVECL